jgi:hypothetical protein
MYHSLTPTVSFETLTTAFDFAYRMNGIFILSDALLGAGYKATLCFPDYRQGNSFAVSGLCFETQRHPILYCEPHFSNPLVEAFI